MYLSRNQQVLLILFTVCLFFYLLSFRIEVFALPFPWYPLLLAGLYALAGLDTVNQWERRPIMFFGWYAWTAGPGIIWIPPILFQMLPNVSVREESTDIIVEDARTKDNVPLRMVLVVTKRVAPERVRDFVVNVKDGAKAVDSRAEAATVEVVGSEEWEQIQHDRTVFSGAVTNSLIGKIVRWGVQIVKVEIKNIVITDLQIAEAVARVAITIAIAKAENILSENLAGPAKIYGVPVYVLRQLIAAERGMTGQGNTMVASDVLNAISRMNPAFLASVDTSLSKTVDEGANAIPPSTPINPKPSGA
jgi:hypothetical protein